VDGPELKSSIIAQAHALGFAAVRCAGIHPATHAAEYQQWVADGCHGDMAWMARNIERRSDPGLVLPGAQTMLVLAMNYFQGPLPPPAGAEGAARGASGVIARYAWGADYHDMMEARLHELSAFLTSLGGTQRVYVDTGPVLERDFATDGGLGWNGKSTVQIHRQLGTWFFLGEILTTLLLPRDTPEPDRCGTCSRCLTACPTQAITAPHRVDARRCVSYLTIEHKGSIPIEFRRAIGNRLYGCDDCLSACPWNRFAQESQELTFAARDYVHDWPLRDFLPLDDEGFRTVFAKSPIKRIKRPRFLRNVCVVLGNIGTCEDVPALEQLLAGEPDPLIAEHAHWALSEIRSRMPGSP
jgi:epoxyqueuosine reductase